MTNFRESEVKIIANRSITIGKFEGIDTLKARVASKSTADMVNLRINSEGSVKKREGYRRLTTFGGGIRAIWTGEIEDVLRCYVLTGDVLYSVDPETGAQSAVGTVGTYDGDADMFYYRNSLYLIDGQALYRVSHGGLSLPFGYVPLIGKDWDDYTGGDVYEPRNLLNDKGRISYVSSENASSVLRLHEPVSSIDAVYVNGELISPERYAANTAGTVLNISGLRNGDRTTVYFTYASSPYTPEGLMSCTQAEVFGGISNSRPFLFGGRDKAVMYSAAYASPISVNEAKRVYPESDCIYFPYGYEFSVGDGRYPISSVCRHYDRLLIFTSGDTWMADSNACGLEEFPVMNINSSVGVRSTGGAVMLENFPYTVGCGGVFKWTAETDERNDCNAYRISEPIEECLGDEFFDRACAFANRRKREILFSCPELSSRTWVYSVATSSWTSFSGVDAHSFFELGSRIGFVNYESLYLFDDDLYTDDGREIRAEFVSGNISFDSNEKKRLGELCLTFEGGDVQVCVYKDGSSVPASTHSFYSDARTTMRKQKLHIGRADYVSVRITAPSESRQTLHALYIGVENNQKKGTK